MRPPRFSAGLLLAAWAWRAFAGSEPSSAEATAGPERLKENVRVTIDTNAPPAAVTETNVEKRFSVQASWLGWDGLHLELNRRTRLPNPAGPFTRFMVSSNGLPPVCLDQVQMTLNLGARIEVDGAAFLTSGVVPDFANDVELRRALFTASGDCILVFPVSYEVQVGYRANNFYLNKSYLASEDLNYIGRLQVGVFSPPMGLELITSSRDITFMEPAAALQAIGPPNETGIQIGHPVLNQRATWALGIFGDAATDFEYGNASHNYGSAMGRLTWLALDHLDPDHPWANRFLHLGLSANLQYSVTSDIEYRSRPESYIAPIVIDTGVIDASKAVTVAAEVAWVNGPFSVQGEFIHALVQGTNSLNFGGFYAEASWYLTGESRPYDTASGAFQRLVPLRNFNLGRGGAWGAVELACRFSHTDLDDGYVQGGRLNLFMAGLNWYLNPNVRWMFNCGVGRVSGGEWDGHMLIAQTRIGVDF
jgi:phosphate-selective porin OprO and OprP